MSRDSLGRWLWRLVLAVVVLGTPVLCLASEANLKLPDLDDKTQASFMGLSGRSLLMWGLLICLGGMAFGLYYYRKLKALPVHRSMLEVSELIYETCKAYLKTQGKFILMLWVFIAAIIVVYFGFLQQPDHAPAVVSGGEAAAHDNIPTAVRVATILLFSLVGIAGSYSVAWFGIRINTFANSRTAFASLRGGAFPCHSIPLQAGMSIGMVLISVELILMLAILLFLPGNLAGPCFIGFAIGESLGAAVLRVAVPSARDRFVHIVGDGAGDDHHDAHHEDPDQQLNLDRQVR